MSNFLDMRCPKCGDENQIDIAATIWVRVTDDGTDADAAGDGGHEYTPENSAVCRACDHWGQARDFDR